MEKKKSLCEARRSMNGGSVDTKTKQRLQGDSVLDRGILDRGRLVLDQALSYEPR